MIANNSRRDGPEWESITTFSEKYTQRRSAGGFNTSEENYTPRKSRRLKTKYNHALGAMTPKLIQGPRAGKPTIWHLYTVSGLLKGFEAVYNQTQKGVEIGEDTRTICILVRIIVGVSEKVSYPRGKGYVVEFYLDIVSFGTSNTGFNEYRPWQLIGPKLEQIRGIFCAYVKSIWPVIHSSTYKSPRVMRRTHRNKKAGQRLKSHLKSKESILLLDFLRCIKILLVEIKVLVGAGSLDA
ncbi:hypothetical protein IW261DRAFT_1424811 [Armillaria novae-zelandiae]|uniref:Uncharacterized protein n=1 Tax=Armillaria novae-zelandiae TaxID=153914 RepID=A0AA39U6P9_9AGAR|nr:hypothetical protein IW261DRAFT_1424811 [Armillaria novae-zelandiae]